MKRLVILGSTGSIGTQTLDVVRQNPDRFKVVALSCARREKEMLEQAEENTAIPATEPTKKTLKSS